MEKNICIITGATGGLGTEFCKKLASQGKNLLLTATNQQRLNALKSTLIKEFNLNKENILCCECNLADENSRKNLFDFILKNNLKVETLINNAGFIVEGAIKLEKSETLLKAIKINCEGTVDITKFVVDNHKKDDKLKILTVSSFAGFYPMPYMAIYAATKSFLLSFMSALRYEVKNQNIKVCTVAPSGIYTTNDMKEAIKAQGVGGKLSSKSPAEIAEIALKGLDKNKSIIIPGFFNKFTKVVCNCVPNKTVTKVIGKRWKKSQTKRNIRTD